MKTTFDLPEALVERAKRHAQRKGQPMRALVEEGLRLVLEADKQTPRYRLPDLSVGKAGGKNPLESMTWSDLRDTIYHGK